MESTDEKRPRVVVILGCRVQGSEPSTALERRLERARILVDEEGAPDLILMSGGKSWGGAIEALVMASWWQTRGLPGVVMVETESQNTRQNAEYSVRLLRQSVAKDGTFHLVTCDYHMARAEAEFLRFGQSVQVVPARSERSLARRMFQLGREALARLSSFLLCVGLLFGSASCQSGGPSPLLSEAHPLANIPKVPPHPGASQGLRVRAREPSPDDFEVLSRVLLGAPDERIWGAFGLGRLCASSSDKPGGVEDALILSASQWLVSEPLPAQSELIVLAQALGSCASDRAETALRAWLQVSMGGTETRLARSAAQGLGTLADRRGRLDDQTLSRLLDLADSSKTPSLLYPLGRIARLSRAVSERTIEVAGKLLLSGSSESLRDAIFALGSAGSPAASALSAIVESPRYKLPERTAAAQALARLGERGNKELDELVRELIARGVPSDPKSGEWPVLLATIHSLTDADVASESLDLLRRSPLPKVEPGPGAASQEAERRRLIHLRCRAAELQAGSHYDHQHLRSCDPDHTFIGKFALLRVLDKVKFEGPAKSTMAELLEDSDPSVAESALGVALSHREFLPAKAAVLKLGHHPHPRLKAAALSAISVHPERFQLQNEPDPEVVQLVHNTLTSTSDPPEVLVRALDAAGALRALTLKPAVEGYCSRRSLAGHALAEASRRALGLLGDPKHPCGGRSEVPAASPSPAVPRSYELESAVGKVRITLQAELSPLAVTTLESELEGGRFGRGYVSAAREGFLVEWSSGEPLAERPSFPLSYAEVSPEPPRAGDILFQPPETPGGQGALLLSLSDSPQLAGKKAIVGRFEGPVELLVPGDRLSFRRAP